MILSNIFIVKKTAWQKKSPCRDLAAGEYSRLWCRIYPLAKLLASYNTTTLKNAHGVAVLSFVKGKSGRLEKYGDLDSSNAHFWEAFDAGIACQTFCLAAHAKGVGTCIFGVIDDDAIAEIVGLPEEETVAALIVYGYPEELPVAPPRKAVKDVARFI